MSPAARERAKAFIIIMLTIILTLIVLALIGDPAPSEPRLSERNCIDEETKVRIRALSLDAYDEALKKHTSGLFQVWMLDEKDQPGRASVGMAKGINAYVRSRALALSWNPPGC